ncbi:MAG: ECF transporter S component [Rikenellaceae bacterium]|nr:ECF transporter S component [Rikenellaceae bacterium]
MQTTSIKLYTMGYNEAKTYLVAAMFIVGNIALPQLCHLMPQGGMIWLPIYFFTLIGAYKYGWKVGLLTAIASPLLNHILFGMPAAAVLVPILVKSTLLALAAGYTASHTRKVSIIFMAAVVAFYQIVGGMAEWAMVNFDAAMQDFRLGLPGMALQIVGGYLFIKYLLRK